MEAVACYQFVFFPASWGFQKLHPGITQVKTGVSGFFFRFRVLKLTEIGTPSELTPREWFLKRKAKACWTRAKEHVLNRWFYLEC